MRFLRVELPILVLILAVPLGAQDPPRRDPQAAAVLANSLAALRGDRFATSPTLPRGIGGAGLYKVYVSGSPVTHTLRFKLLGFDRFRWEVDGPDGTTVVVIAGNGGWTESPRGMSTLSLSQTSGRRTEIFPILTIARGLASLDVGLDHEGQETVAGRTVHRIGLRQAYMRDASEDFRVAFEKVNRYELLVDTTTLLPVRLRYAEHPGDWRLDIPVELEFSGFQSVDGVLVPLTITRYIGGQVVSQVELTSINFNAAVTVADFQRR